MRRSLLLALLLLFLCSGTVLAESRVDARVRHIASQLRCPVCQNESVADSQSDLAQNIRQVIREKVEQGESDQQILDYFVRIYGEQILMDPPKRGFGLLAWAQPVLVVLAGALVLALALNRWVRARPRAEPETDGDDPELQRYEAALDEELRRYRAGRG